MVTSDGPGSEDRDEIRNVLGRMAQLADRGRLDELEAYVDCFTDDGIFETPMGTQRGKDEIRASAKERRSADGPTNQTRHIVGSTEIRFEGPDRAVVQSNFIFGGPGPDGPPAVMVIGHYDDEFRRTGSGWRLGHRKISFA
jgi:3-phenylpropionate/cinnamic acid dioxygenase small subunit